MRAARAEEFSLQPLWMSGGVGSSLGEYGTPESVAIDSLDRVVVTDKGRMMLHVYDSKTGEPLLDVGGIGSALGRFNRPNGIVVDDQGHILVVEQTNQRVQVLDRDYQPLRSWGGSSRFQKPMGIAIGPDRRIYVTDEGRADVQAFDAQGNFLFRFERSPLLDKVESIEVDAPGNRILVCDEGRSAVFIYDMQGRYVSQFGREGSGPGEFGDDTNAVRLDGRRRIYVNDQGNQRINVYHSDTRFLASFRNAAGGLDSADGVALSESHNLFLIADQGHNRVVAFDLGEIQCRLSRIELEAANGAEANSLLGSFDAEPRSNPTPPWADGTLHLEARLASGNPALVETAIAHVRSDRDPRGICVTLVETSAGSRVLRGTVQLGPASDEAGRRLATRDADTVRAHLAGEDEELRFEFEAAAAPTIESFTAGGAPQHTTFVGDRPRLEWRAVYAPHPGITHHELRLVDEAGGEIWSTGMQQGGPTQRVYDGPPLGPGRAYTFHLRLATGRAWSDWASIRVVRNRAPEPPRPVAPAAAERIARWPASFRVPVAADPDGHAVTGRIELRLPTGLVRSRELVALDGTWTWIPEHPVEDNTALQWRAVASDPYEATPGPWRSLVVDAADEDPVPQASRAPPADAIVDAQRIVFEWDAAHDPDPLARLTYQIEWSPTPDFPTPTLIGPLTTRRIEWIPLVADGTYYWRVRAIDETGRSAAGAASRLRLERTSRIVLRADAPGGALRVELGTRPGASNAVAGEDAAAGGATGEPRLASAAAGGVWLARDLRAPHDAAVEPVVFRLRLSGAGTAPVRLRAESVSLPGGWRAAIRETSGRTRESFTAPRDLGTVLPAGAQGAVEFELVLDEERPRAFEEEVVPVAQTESPVTAAATATTATTVESRGRRGPVAAGTRLRLAPPGAVRMQISVYDVRGRRVRLGRTDTDGTWLWDGRDARGRRLSRGVYWLRAQGAGTSRLRVVWAG